MWNSFVGMLYNKDSAVKWFKGKNPDEEIVFASAATFLETNGDTPVGLSTKRFFQKQGVFILARTQLVFKANAFSLTAIVYFLFLVYSLILMFAEREWSFIIPALFFFAGLAQRRPFEKHVRVDDIQDVKLEEIISMRGKYPIIMIYLAGKVIQIVTAQVPNREILEAIKPSKS